MATHSDKALKTLTLMGVTPERSKHADMRWEKRTVRMPGEVNCPDCQGNRWALKDAAGKVVPYPKKEDFPPTQSWHKGHDSSAYSRALQDHMNAARAQARTDGNTGWYGNCGRCRCTNPRARMYGHSTGKVMGVVEVEAWVGIVLWPAGTRFDSRFNDGSRYCCELCSKTLSLQASKSGRLMGSPRVPVVGLDEQGNPHGLWVGEDCARKFLPGVHTYVNPDGKKDFLVESAAA